MKLYTEQQVREMINKSQVTGLNADYLLLTTPHLELPSDSEIHKELDIKFNHRWNIVSLGVYDGAKWMRDKIQGGNK